MLLCGIQQVGLEEGHITLFDEVEFGLEPHRISRLIKHVREDKRGQYFLTTHSPAVLRELTINELYVVHSKAGNVQIIAASSDSLKELEVQGKIRSSAEAFLAKKVVVCEGATEVGFLRGFDDHHVGKGSDPFSYHGVALLNAGGASNVKGLAKAFKGLCYDVAVLADADAPKLFSPADEEELKKLKVNVYAWSDMLSLEERAFQDLPWPSVVASLQLAQDDLKFPVYDNVRSKVQKDLDKDLNKWIESPELKTAIGRAAKDSGWFKDITRGDKWFATISPAFSDPDFSKKDTAVKLASLWTWASNV